MSRIYWLFSCTRCLCAGTGPVIWLGPTTWHYWAGASWLQAQKYALSPTVSNQSITWKQVMAVRYCVNPELARARPVTGSPVPSPFTGHSYRTDISLKRRRRMGWSVVDRCLCSSRKGGDGIEGMLCYTLHMRFSNFLLRHHYGCRHRLAALHGHDW